MTQKIKSIAALILAGLLYAAALKYFVLPSRIILTGTEGIAAATSYYFKNDGLFVGMYLLFQAVLLGFAWFGINRSFAWRTMLVVGTVIGALVVLPELTVADPDPTNERLILVIFGGLLAGGAKALAFKHSGSTGDEDVMGAYFAIKYLKPVGFISIIAAVVSTAYGLLLEWLGGTSVEGIVNTLMYTCVYIFASAETLNSLYKRFKITILTVVTTRHDEVSAAISRASEHRTCTIEDAEGGRSGQPFKLVRTILTLEELPDVLTHIQEVDAECFYFYHDVEGVSQRYYITPIGR